MAWFSSGRITNPVLDQVLVDTGPIQGGSKNFQVYAASTGQAAFEIQWRDAANAITKKSQILAVPAFGYNMLFPLVREIELLDNERLRVVAVQAITGSVSVSLDVTV